MTPRSWRPRAAVGQRPDSDAPDSSCYSRLAGWSISKERHRCPSTQPPQVLRAAAAGRLWDSSPRRSSTTLGEVRVTVNGMDCRQCVREITARLRDIPGVRTVVADPNSRTVHLTGEMTEQDVTDVLSRSG